MNRSRLVVAASTFVVAAGALTAVGALYLDPARAAVGPLPAEGLALPADAQFVMGIDVRRFVASPFYARFGEEHAAARPKAFAEMEEKTGINPERDVDAIYVAGRKGAEGKRHGGDGVVIVVGTFDRYKVQRAIETAPKAPTTASYKGTPMYLFDEESGKRKSGAVAFLDDKTLVMGSRSGVEQAITARASGGAGVRSNPEMIALLESVRPGSTFWMVGDQSVLAHMPQGLPAPGGASGESMALPPLKTVVVTGDLDPVMSFEATGEAADAAAAQNLADVVRGFVALASLHATQKPELKQLASAVSVTTDQNKVRVAARFPYEMLESLRTKKKAARAEVTE